MAMTRPPDIYRRSSKTFRLVTSTVRHDAFRHSAPTILNKQTGNLKLIQNFLGRADISTAANIYTHPSDESDRGASVAIERAIFGDLFPVVPNIENGNSSGNPK
jgi:integrase